MINAEKILKLKMGQLYHLLTSFSLNENKGLARCLPHQNYVLFTREGSLEMLWFFLNFILNSDYCGE